MDTRYFVNGKLVECEVAADAVTPRSKASLSSKPESKVTPDKLEPVTNSEAEGLETLLSKHRFLALSLPSCPQCDLLAEALESRGVPKSVFVKWNKGDASYPTLKASLAKHAGDGFTFPQVFADGIYQGGFHDVLAKIEDGVYDELFQKLFAVEPTTVQRLIRKQPMVVLSLPNCPQCDELRAKLEERGLRAQDIFVKWDKATPQYQSLKAQLIQLTGQSQFTFPQTFVSSVYQGGFHEVTEKLAAGNLDSFFSETFGIEKPKVEEPAPQVACFDEDF